jgi:uncharacterized protein
MLTVPGSQLLMRSAKYKVSGDAKEIGLISDTHGLLRPEVPGVLQGVDLIIHAGDIGKPGVLESLSQIAPVYAIRGNNDREQWAKNIPDLMHITIGGVKLYVIHAVQDLAIDPAVEGVDVVISGHSHKPLIQNRAGVLYINPGSAGPRRFKLPIAVGKLRLDGGRISPELITL